MRSTLHRSSGPSVARWMALAFSSAVLLLNLTAARADTVLSWSCLLNLSECPSLANQLGISATIDFSGSIPTDGTTFSDSGTLSVNAEGFSQSISLPSSIQYAYAPPNPGTGSSIPDLHVVGGAFPSIIIAGSLSPPAGSIIPNYIFFDNPGGTGFYFEDAGTYAPLFNGNLQPQIAQGGQFEVSTPSPSASLYLTVNTGGPNSASGPGHPTSITATLSLATTAPSQPHTYQVPVELPSGASISTLQQAASALGFDDGFEWIQQITTLPNPSPLSECASAPPCNSADAAVIPLTSASTPFNDPPPNSYNSCNPCVNPYPFAVALSSALNSERMDTTLSFTDAPADFCIANDPGGSPSVGYNELANAGYTLPCAPPGLAEAGSYLSFTTELVGVTGDFIPGTDCIALGTCTELDEFTWTDSFNGINSQPLSGTGGIATEFSTLDGDIPVDPESGTGGTTITSVGDMPVPEPSSALMLVTGIIALMGMLKGSRDSGRLPVKAREIGRRNMGRDRGMLVPRFQAEDAKQHQPDQVFGEARQILHATYYSDATSISASKNQEFRTKARPLPRLRFSVA
jgi:hypothetical protein